MVQVRSFFKRRPHRMKRRDFLRLGACGAASVALGSLVSLKAAEKRSAKGGGARERPNIVFILADDIGYGDLGCYGATLVQTPRTDRIAREGMVFTHAHSPSAVCAPTRYGIMTGRYPWRLKRTAWATAQHALFIEKGRMTLASMLKSAGYTNGYVGKWNLGLMNAEKDWNADLKPGPLEVGFDYFFGDAANRNSAGRGGSFYIENHRVVGLREDDPIRFGEEIWQGRPVAKLLSGESALLMKHEENARILTERAVSFIERSKDKPFFLYFSPNNVHVPNVPNPRFKGTSRCGAYGDCIHELDWQVGQVTETLDRLGLADNTLFIYTSDNGGGYLREPFDAGHRCCGDLLGQKGDVWEGGHRVPFIVRWPGRTKPDTRSDALVCLTDIFATCAGVVDVPLPDEAAPDSFNILPVILGGGDAGSPRDALVIHKGTNVGNMYAVQQGDWKLILGQGSDGPSTGRRGPYMGYADLGFENSDYTADGTLKADAPPGQLYNLREDPRETTNIYGAHPEVVARLTGLLEETRKRGRSRP